MFAVRSPGKLVETFQMSCEQQGVEKYNGGARRQMRDDVSNRLLRIQLWDGAQMTEIGTAMLNSDNWDKSASLVRWSPTFTRGENSDMRIHHIFISAMFEYFRRIHVKALISQRLIKQLNDTKLPTYPLVFDLDTRNLFEDATIKDLSHLRKWAKKTPFWDQTELLGNGMGGWLIPAEISNECKTLCNYQNPRNHKDTSSITFQL